MESKNYKVTYLVNQPAEEIFNKILNVRQWWSGLFAEEIEGNSEKLNDEFAFVAGGGMHYSRQKMVQNIPDKKVVWLVTDSALSFISKQDEWTGTQLCFELFDKDKNSTEVVFTHIGLVPQIECYDSCSNAWSSYMENFLAPLV